jgi:hypothetical protein
LDEFNFAIASFAVVVGIGVTDIAQSLHRLLIARTNIVWSALPLLAAAYIALVLSTVWFQLWLMRNLADALGFWSLTGLLAQALLVYLAAAAVLPDRPGRDGDIAAYYWRQRANIWLPMTLFSAVTIGFSLYLNWLLPYHSIAAWEWVWRLAPLPVYGAMALSNNALLHWGGLTTLTALLVERTIDWTL